MSKLLSHLPALCNVVRRVAFEAGEITLDYFEEGMVLSHDTKPDGSPVTDADRRAEEFIAAQLKDAVPGIPVLGEERANNIDDKDSDYFWLVDPLDGTREFVSGGTEFTVNIALIKNGAPVLGVVYAPAKGEMYAAHGEGTAVRWLSETEVEKPIQVRRPVRAGLTVMASKNRHAAELEAFCAEQKVEKIIRRGSSLKICAVASGKADIYPGFGPTCLWDTAAGQAILEAAGGEIVAQDGGAPLTYSMKKDGFFNPPFVARSKFLA
jgi:3'(2'), 5'-bisphosphate nucleotidase